MPLLQALQNDVTVPLLGVPLTVLGTAAGGAFASFAYGSHETSRVRLFVTAIVNTFLAALSVAVFPVWLNWEWLTPVLKPPVAGLLAFIARWVVPLVVEMAPQWIRNKLGTIGQSNQPTSGDPQ
jgi:hypothetical protein